ncbi:MAG: HEAT repeat domain-containing protein [Edaphobacter sp.]|uniref:HEAT repeat domain-containing protein n=1 Tax=Edaphobacter sp. TaxID=1934404 RepID=UPI00239BDA02|nr:HEAT repeat domain-containing protein [Edaphobacter sp.]MDE1178517.1 HEAT repeat domain-containing protein [Edaphobacter sp.]
MAKDNIVLAYYGELPDELAGSLEHHLMTCDECRVELEMLQAMEPNLASLPMVEPSPNFLTQSRMRLDDALDLMPPRGVLTRLRTNFFVWMGHLRSAPALATLLIGVGFIGGNFVNRYQIAHAPKPIADKFYKNDTQAVIANVTGIDRTPDSELVQVHYNKIVPETIEGSLDSPEVRELLLKGASATTDDVRSLSVSMLANECKHGHQCAARDDGKGVRNALLVALRYDKDAGVRLKALEGLQPYIAQDHKVRDAVLDSLANDPDAKVRMTTVSLLEPVQHDSSVRQVLRHASTDDENPYIRTVSYQALQGSDSIQ